MIYIKLFTDRLESISELDDDEAGRVFKAVLAYANGAEMPPLTKVERIVFLDMKRQIDQESGSYDAMCARNRRNGTKRKSAPEEPTGTQSEPVEPSGTQSVDEEPTGTQSDPVEPSCGKEKKRERKEKEKESTARARETLDDFNRFWAAYPRHTAKADALREWQKLRPDKELQAVILNAIEQQKASPQWQDGERFVPHPRTWLHQRRWEDEPPKATSNSGRVMPAQQYSQRDYSGMDDALPDWVIQKGREMGILGGGTG